MRTKLAALSIITALALAGCSAQATEQPTDVQTTTQASESVTTDVPTQEQTTEVAPQPPRDVNVAALAPGSNTWELTSACIALFGTPEQVAQRFAYPYPTSLLDAKKGVAAAPSDADPLTCTYMRGHGDNSGIEARAEQSTDCSLNLSAKGEGVCVQAQDYAYEANEAAHLDWVDEVVTRVKLTGDNDFGPEPAPPADMPRPTEAVSLTAVKGLEGREAMDMCLNLVGSPETVQAWLGEQTPLQLGASTSTFERNGEERVDGIYCSYHVNQNTANGYTMKVSTYSSFLDGCHVHGVKTSDGSACVLFDYISESDRTVWTEVPWFQLHQWTQAVASKVTA